VALACSIVGAEIRYTTNGSEPTSASTLYSGVIDVNTLTTLRAKAFKTGWTASGIS
jgi:chitinase